MRIDADFASAGDTTVGDLSYDSDLLNSNGLHCACEFYTPTHAVTHTV
jgi:hypothetical protein